MLRSGLRERAETESEKYSFTPKRDLLPERHGLADERLTGNYKSFSSFS